ncbi:MAG: hypothetical protein M1834_008581 [Cirrosporium novae-zelandiae]|nr:MAG: hypothetical protein M1834_008581 [Cirrosporium novae-zelandiae]
MFSQKTSYAQIPSSESLSYEVDEPDQNGRPLSQFRKSFCNLPTITILLANLLLFSISLTLLIHGTIQKPTDAECIERTSIYSPLLEAIKYEDRDYENYFSHPSIYRGPPTAEREAAWWNLTHFGGISIPEEKLHLLNRSTETMNIKRVPPEAGGGYLALVENLIRQYTWYLSSSYNKTTTSSPQNPPIPVPIPGSFLASSEVGNRMHVDHCIETLRLTLMCQADVTPFLVYLDPEAPMGERVDFNTHHRCRDWGRVVEWMGVNTAVP